MKKLVVFMLLFAVLSCREEFKKSATPKNQGLNQFLTKFDALSFKSFIEFQRAANDPKLTNLDEFKISRNSDFTSLSDVYATANQMRREFIKSRPTDKSQLGNLEAKLLKMSPMIGVSTDKGLYLKLFNPGFARLLNGRGEVIIGGDLYSFGEDSYARIAAKDVLALNSFSVDEVWNRAPKSVNYVRTTSDRKNADETHIVCNSLSMGQPQDCETIEIFGVEVGYCWGSQRVDGCFYIYKYLTPHYDWIYTCDYQPPYPTTDENGNPLPCVDGDCSWPCDYYPIITSYVTTYDVVAYYEGKQNFYAALVDWGIYDYDVTVMTLKMYHNGTLFAQSAVTDASRVEWSHSGYTNISGNIRADLYVQDTNTITYFPVPSAPAVANTLGFW